MGVVSRNMCKELAESALPIGVCEVPPVSSDALLPKGSIVKYKPKFKLIEDSVVEGNDGGDGIVYYYRIKALRSFSDVRRGDIGGYVTSADNLSQEGICWIYSDAMVHNSTIRQSAKVYGNAKVFGSDISGFCKIKGDCVVDKCALSGHVYVGGNASLYNCLFHHDVSISPLEPMNMNVPFFIQPISIGGRSIVENLMLNVSGRDNDEPLWCDRCKPANLVREYNS